MAKKNNRNRQRHKSLREQMQSFREAGNLPTQSYGKHETPFDVSKGLEIEASMQAAVAEAQTVDATPTNDKGIAMQDNRHPSHNDSQRKSQTHLRTPTQSHTQSPAQAEPYGNEQVGRVQSETAAHAQQQSRQPEHVEISLDIEAANAQYNQQQQRSAPSMDIGDNEEDDGENFADVSISIGSTPNAHAGGSNRRQGLPVESDDGEDEENDQSLIGTAIDMGSDFNHNGDDDLSADDRADNDGYNDGSQNDNPRQGYSYGDQFRETYANPNRFIGDLKHGINIVIRLNPSTAEINEAYSKVNPFRSKSGAVRDFLGQYGKFVSAIAKRNFLMLTDNNEQAVMAMIDVYGKQIQYIQSTMGGSLGFEPTLTVGQVEDDPYNGKVDSFRVVTNIECNMPALTSPKAISNLVKYLNRIQEEFDAIELNTIIALDIDHVVDPKSAVLMDYLNTQCAEGNVLKATKTNYVDFVEAGIETNYLVNQLLDKSDILYLL